MDIELAKAAIAEATGTFALTFVAAAAICTDVYSGGEAGLLGIALAQGLILSAIVVAFGATSGAHVNPAVTLGALLVGMLTPLRAAVYFGAQMVGAVVAGLMVAATFAADVWEPVQLGTPLLGPGVAPGTGVFIETVLTMLLVLTVLRVASSDAEPGGAPLAIGATLAAAVLIAGPLTGGALNPARAFGPAFASGHWAGHQVYWIGPLLGAVFASVCHGLLGPWTLALGENPTNEAEIPAAGSEEDESV